MRGWTRENRRDLVASESEHDFFVEVSVRLIEAFKYSLVISDEEAE